MSKLTWVMTCGAFALGLSASLPATAQDETQGSRGPYPRPHIVTEGEVTVRQNGLTIKYYVSDASQSGTAAAARADKLNDGERDSQEFYVFYEPPILLRVNEEGSIDATAASNGVVTLNFHWDTDPHITREAIKKAISGTEYEKAKISPFFVEDAWFEPSLKVSGSVHPRARSTSFRRQSFTTSGMMRTYFRFKTPEEAEGFITGLNGGDSDNPPLQLNFHYTFSGVSSDICTAHVSSEEMSKVSRLKELSGEGSADHVTRDQLAEIANEVFSKVNIRATCRDINAADRLTERALKRVGAPGSTVETWEQLDQFATLDPRDFVADLTKRLDESDKTVARDQLRSATASVTSEQMAGSVAGGWAGFMAAMSGSLAKASQEARSEFEDHLKKASIHAIWEGERYVPKGLEVYIVRNRSLPPGVMVFPSVIRC